MSDKEYDERQERLEQEYPEMIERCNVCGVTPVCKEDGGICDDCWKEKTEREYPFM